MKKRLGKTILSIVLIICAVAGLVLWEMYGRESVMTTELIIAACDIREGQVIEAEMLGTAGVLKENVLDDYMKPGEYNALVGQRADCDIKKNQQLTMELMRDETYRLGENLAPCVIPGELILTMSSSVRKGDTVCIYDGQAMHSLGEYKVAFAKDASNQEIVDLDNPGAHKKILERTNSNGVLHHLEIEAGAEAYAVILSKAAETGGLVIMQKGD